MEGQQRRGAAAWWLLVAVCLAAPWVTRAILLVEKRHGVHFVDLRGFLSDGSVALLAIGLIGLCLATRRAWGRVLAWIVATGFILSTFAIYEVVAAFDSLHGLAYARLVADPIFVGGSVRHLAHPVLLATMLGLVTLGTAFGEAPRKAWWGRWALASVLVVFAQVALPMSHASDEWRQRHAVHALASSLPARSGLGVGTVSAEVRQVFSADLDGERRFDPIPGRPNVLLILLEAASGPTLPSIADKGRVDALVAMPKLDARAGDHLLFTQVVAHQRQTNRGEYGILCGDYPKLLSDQSKMTEQVYGRARRCLPQALRDAGYATAYIQAAPLAFMLKDQFMPRAGFDRVIGDEAFPLSYGRTDWGVDDRAFFEQALATVEELHEQEQPFFATLLTVGTHHPFTLPQLRGESARERAARAFLWADDALDEFLDSLGRGGFLDDTIVVITSDESGAWIDAESPTERLLAQSWSFALVILPEPQVGRVETLYAHSDLALSVLDLLGIAEPTEPFIGRSWFRDYETPRPLFAGNTYAKRVISWKPDGDSVICDEGFRDCRRFARRKRGAFSPRPDAKPAAPHDRHLLAEVARLTRSGRVELSSAEPMALLTSEEARLLPSEGKKLLAGGQYLRVPADSVVRVDFDIEVEGKGAAVRLHQDVFIEGYERFARKKVLVQEGQRWRLRYEVPVREASGQLVVQLYATGLSGEPAVIRFHEAGVAIDGASLPSEEVVVIEERLTPAASP